MQEITSITSSPNQRMTLVLENNETADFRLYYSIRQQCWFYDFSYKETTVNCSKVVLSPNSIRQFKRILPFGIAFAADSFVEPFSIDDFALGRVKMYVLNSVEVEEIESEIFND